MGLAPIGCAPYYLWKYDSKNGECIEEINDVILEFNFVMRYTIEEIGRELPDANFIFCDVYEGSMDIIKNHEKYGNLFHPSAFIDYMYVEFRTYSAVYALHYLGFNVTSDACCGLGKYNGWITCLAPEMACSNATNHIWWDQYHPTDAVNAILADNVWNSLHTRMCYPMNLQEMISSKAK